MFPVTEFAKLAAMGGGAMLSVLLSGLSAHIVRFGECDETLARHAAGFLALFAVSLAVYLVFL